MRRTRPFALVRLGRRSLAFVAVSTVAIGFHLRANPSRPYQATVTVPPWIGSATCSLQNGQRFAASDGRMSLTCGVAGRLSCDGDEIEPLDVDLDATCRNARVDFLRGSPIEVLTSSTLFTRSATIDWLDFHDGRLTSTATRQVNLLNGHGVINVSSTNRRYLRATRLGSSPITSPGLDLITSGRWRLPQAALGGELTILPVVGTVIPYRYLLDGPRLTTVGASNTPIFLSGLPPGNYNIVPLYDGGVSGLAIPVAINAGDSTILPMRAQPVGAISVSATGQCPSDADLHLLRLTGNSRSHDDTVLAHSTGCRWSLSGLQPGSYIASIQSPRGAIGRADFQLREQQSVQITTVPSRVTLDGTIRVNGKPAPRAVIFARKLDDPLEVRTTADLLGQFILHVDDAGLYDFRPVIDNDVVIRQSLRRQLSAGPTSITLELSLGSASIRLSGQDPSRPATVTLRNGHSTYSSTSIPNPLTIAGIPPGHYDVSAVQSAASRLVSLRATGIDVQASAQATAVDLPMGLNSSHLLLRTTSNAPVRGAILTTIPMASRRGASDSAIELAPGDYSLSTYPVGTHLNIIPSPPLLPLCRLVPASGQVRVDIPVGRPAELRFVGPTFNVFSPSMGGLDGIPTSDCTVPFSHFTFTPLAAAGGAARFRITNFPDATNLAWTMDSIVEHHEHIDLDSSRIVTLHPPLATSNQGRLSIRQGGHQ